MPAQFASTDAARHSCEFQCEVSFVAPTPTRASRYSDHALVWVRLSHGAVRKPFVRPRPPNLNNWAPVDFESRNVFGTLVDVQVQQQERREGGLDLEEMETTLLNSATMIRHTKGRLDTRPIKKPEQLMEVEEELKRGAFGDHRKELLRRKKTLRRQFKRQQLLRDSAGPRNSKRRHIKELKCDGVLTENKQEWVREINKHASTSYSCDGEGNRTKNHIRRLRERLEEQDVITTRVITMGTLLAARARLKGGRQRAVMALWPRS